MKRLSACVCVVVTILVCGGASSPRAGFAETTRWDPVIVWEGDAAFERVKVGRPDASDPLPQIVGVDQAGRMVLVHWNGGRSPRAEVVYENHSEMTGLAIADVDPAVPGEEIYAGAYEPGKDEVGGVVLQVSVDHGRSKVRRIFSPGAYVHTIEVVPPVAPGAATRLVIGTYAGEIHVLTPTAGDALWESRLIYRDPPLTDPQPKDPRPRIKDMALLRDPTGRPPHEVFAVFAGGRALAVDLDRPESAVIVAEENGGWGRTCADEGTGAYACGYSGRVVRFRRDAAGAFAADVLEQEGTDSGLRGVVMGRFPLPGCGTEIAPLAIFGFHAHCRALVRRNGAWDPVTLFTDTGRGHTLVAADLVEGNDADELVLSGYSKRIAVLVPVRE
ncbi:MAG: hypothetical protein U0572_16095 [Phycisphaerales bacterium]